jgi:hypothetical protein
MEMMMMMKGAVRMLLLLLLVQVVVVVVGCRSSLWFRFLRSAIVAVVCVVFFHASLV